MKTRFPQWADLPLEYFDSGGTVNAIYRLGADMYVWDDRLARARDEVHIDDD